MVSIKKGKVGRAFAALVLAFAPALVLADLAHASCVYPGQEEAVAAAQQAETSSPTVIAIETCGGDDSSYQVPLSVDVTFDGQTFQDIYVTTNSVITFGRPDGTYWDYPQTPSISLYSMDWVVYPQSRSDEHLIINSSDGGFQVDISARPIWLQNTESPTNIIITAAILSDGTVAMAYSVDGPTYDGQTRTGVRLNDGSVVNFEEYGIEEVEESPELAPEPTTESPFVPEPTPDPETESETVSPETESPTTSPETESPTVSPEAESPTVSPEPEVSDPNTIVLVVSEGEVLSYVAPEGYKIDSISTASYGTGDGCHAVDSQIIVESAVTNESLSISATNDVFGDPCPGTVKRLEVVVVIQELPAPEPEPSPSPEPAPQPVAPAPVEPSPEPQPTIPEPVQPMPQPEPTPEETVEPETTPEPTPSTSDDPEPEPEVVPEETPAPSPSETSGPVKPEQKLPTPTPSPEVTATPTPTPSSTPQPSPSQTSPAPKPSPTPTETPKPIEEEKPIVIIPVEPTLVVESLLSVDLETQRIAPEQIAEIRNAVEQVFDEVEKGSEQYEKALEALAVIAEADDAELPEELAAIPVLGTVAGEILNVFNDLGNVGADMAPEQRERAEETVIAAVIVGQVAQIATVSISVGRVK